MATRVEIATAAGVKCRPRLGLHVDLPLVPRPAADAEGRFWQLLDHSLPVAGDALDVGTGTGRVALRMAPRSRRVIGIDVDASALAAARWDAQRRGISNVAFVEADAESSDLTSFNQGRAYALGAARLFLSLALIERVGAALETGGRFVVEALEGRHWHEAGGSRFNLSAADVATALQQAGLRVLEGCIEHHVHEFSNVRDAEAHLKERRLWTKWRADGRWSRLRDRVQRGQRSLTEAHLVLVAQRPDA
jgi:SAM-dependent methyltransferase